MWPLSAYLLNYPARNLPSYVQGCLAVLDYMSLSCKGQDVRKECIWHEEYSCDFVYNWYLKRFSFHEGLSETSYMYFCLLLNKLEFRSHILVRVSNVKFNDSPRRGGQVVPCGRWDTTIVIVAFRSFANSPTIASVFWNELTHRESTRICYKATFLFSLPCTVHFSS